MSRLIEEVKRGEREFQCGGRHSAAPLRLSAEHRTPQNQAGEQDTVNQILDQSRMEQEVSLLGGEEPASVCLFVGGDLSEEEPSRI